MRKLFLILFVVMTLSSSVFAEDVQERYFKELQQSPSVSMDLKNTALVDVLRVFSKQSGLNFVAADDIADKRVTLFLDNVPINEALHRILESHQLTYTVPPNSNIFIVKARSDEVVTRVYHLKYATVSTSKLNTASGESSSASNASNSSSSAGTTATASNITGSSSRGNLVSALRAVISKQGNITEDARTNSLIITDSMQQFPVIEATIAQLDVPVVQIMIEVEMLDISKQTSELMGVKFGEQLLKVTGGTRSVIYPWDQNKLIDKGAYTPTDEYTAGKIDASQMSVILNFIKTRTDTHNLAKPRLLTVNNETAQIRISTNEAIGQTNVEGGQSGNISTQAERVQTGIFLTVTPQVNPQTNEILMSVTPKVIQARRGATFGNTTYRDPEERGTQSLLQVKDGETIVLGGLLREDDSDTETKVPFLGDIPLIGGAFRHKDKQGTQRELIIFITPHIIGRPEILSAQRALEMDTLLDKIEQAR